MSTHSETVSSIYQQIVDRNPGENEFHQALYEVLETLSPVLELSLIHI